MDTKDMALIVPTKTSAQRVAITATFPAQVVLTTPGHFHAHVTWVSPVQGFSAATLMSVLLTRHCVILTQFALIALVRMLAGVRQAMLVLEKPVFRLTSVLLAYITAEIIVHASTQ
jgi:hypothetical protein